MPELLLDRVHSEIRARLRECEAAVCESERLEAALTALAGIQAPTRPAPEPAASLAAPRRRRSSGQRSSGPRAPRGANRAAVLRVLGERPGVSATEVSAASGVARQVLYALLKTLEQRGEIAREQLPDGATGYRIATDGSAPPAAPSETPAPAQQD
jgi:hypothetical protein